MAVPKKKSSRSRRGQRKNLSHFVQINYYKCSLCNKTFENSSSTGLCNFCNSSFVKTRYKKLTLQKDCIQSSLRSVKK